LRCFDQIFKWLTVRIADSFEGDGDFPVSTASKRAILLVEDDEAVRDSLSPLLQAAGYDYSMATKRPATEGGEFLRI
jgi:hypothetical protein